MTLLNLYVVVEARNLSKKATGTSCYCIVDLADQQVRTQTIWKTREPMWMEEFYLYVMLSPRETMRLTFNVDQRMSLIRV